MRSCCGIRAGGKWFHRDVARATITGHVENETAYTQKEKGKQQESRRCQEKES